MKKLSAITIVAAFLSLIGTFSVQASNDTGWPMFHGDAARTGFSNSKVPSSAEVLWEITTDQLREYGVNEFEIQRPIIEDGKVFFATGQVFAVDLSSGKFIWNYKGDSSNFYANFLAAGDDKIFVTVTNSTQLKNMSEGFIYALDESTGELIWKYQTLKQISHPSPVLAEGKVFIGDESGTLYAIEANTGKLVWQQQLEALWIHSSPAYAQGTIYVGTETSDTGDGKTGRGSFLYALDAADGRVLWRFESDWRGYDLANFIHGTPAILDDVVYFGSENGYFYALNEDNGQVIWKKLITEATKTTAREAAGPGLVGISTAPALAYGKIFVGLWDGKFLALDQKDGRIIWEYTYGTEGTDSSAVVADNKVCLGSHFGDFYCFNADNGKVLWKEKLGGPSAALASGILVVPNRFAAAESPGSILVAFSDQGTSAFATTGQPRFAFDSRYILAGLALVGILILSVIAYKALKSKKVTIKQLVIYGGIPLALLGGGLMVYSLYSQSQWTGTQTKLLQEGKIDQATGSLIENDGSPKHVEYQGRKYFLDGGYCARSNLDRLAIPVKRVNGAAGADGADGNTMYAIGSKDSPEYIDSSKVNDPKSDCWKRESP